jgi:hypothetical protein
MFYPITADEKRRVIRRIVVLHQSSLVFPNIQATSCAQHPSNTLKFVVQLFVYHLTTWYKCMIDNAFPIKKHNHNHLDLWPTHPCFLGREDIFIPSSPFAWLSNWTVTVECLPSLQQNFTHPHTHSRARALFFKPFHCPFVTNPTNSLCT